MWEERIHTSGNLVKHSGAHETHAALPSVSSWKSESQVQHWEPLCLLIGSTLKILPTPSRLEIIRDAVCL